MCRKPPANGSAAGSITPGLPAGTVSGAPKVRAMEVIDELETEKRGIYGGGVGYFSAGGDMDMPLNDFIRANHICVSGNIYEQ